MMLDVVCDICGEVFTDGERAISHMYERHGCEIVIMRPRDGDA